MVAVHLSSVFSGLRGLFQGSSTRGHLASVPEESTTGFTDAFSPPLNSYRESIRSVSIVCSEWRVRSTLSDQSRSTDSSDSGASRSNTSSYSSASVGAADLGTSELTKIAHRMVSDGYTQRMVRAFHTLSLTKTIAPHPSLKNWFIELDVDWVLDSRLQLRLKGASANWLQELVKRWIRALTIIVSSINEVNLATRRWRTHEALAIARFGKASISAMLVVVGTILDAIEEDKLQVVLHMYMCVSSASYMSMMPVVPLEAQCISDEVSILLKTEENMLIQAVSSTMMDIKMLPKYDSWAMENIARSGGGIDCKIRFLVNGILSMRIAYASTLVSAQSQNTVKLCDAIDDTINYLKDELQRKSDLFQDPSLGCIFLLNNSYFVAQVMSQSHPSGIKLTPECKKYMDFYLLSWGHVLSCIPKYHSPGLLRRWINTSPLAKFESSFHKTYQTQKFWKVPDPRLRDALRRAIIERVISGYHDYLKEQPALAEQVSRGSSSPQVLEEMLGELFEG
ncbi:hypothetical protein TRIUR3_27971 [Triticum urartu]|uniref:Exocyst subunit Exo70 family protein n=2 Tax=Triticum urartu TaxID=4572 RepID=M7ZCF7_TRIUA|nr:hypothetical protein TRIUR3_27971 [Triticum urartu]